MSGDHTLFCPLALLRLELELLVSARGVLVPIEPQRVELRPQPHELRDRDALGLVLEFTQDFLVIAAVHRVVCR